MHTSSQLTGQTARTKQCASATAPLNTPVYSVKDLDLDEIKMNNLRRLLKLSPYIYHKIYYL